jgi:hypothetical protein
MTCPIPANTTVLKSANEPGSGTPDFGGRRLVEVANNLKSYPSIS